MKNSISSHFGTTLKSALIIPVLVITIIAVSCSNQASNSHNAERIRAQISDYNTEILELNQKISDLEKELEAMGEKTHNRTRTPVVVSEITYQPFEHYFRVNATVEAVQAAIISPETNGQITGISVNKGQRVTQGQNLARLNTAVIENNIAEVKTSLQLAQNVYERQNRLWEQGIGSEIQHLEAKNTVESLETRLKTLQSQLNMSIIKAPFDGIIDEIFAKEGELAMPGSPVMQIINLNNMYVNADVSESFLPHIKSNSRVILRFPAFPEYEQHVPIHRLGNMINPENRTFRLQLKIQNPQERFKPNMIASLGIVSYSADNALVVPSIVIKQDIQGHFVFIARENEEGDLVARKIYIERGLDGEGNTMIQKGLQQGDLLIRQGHNQVSDGTLISISQPRALISTKE
jgi:membrane fusion protein, multidrug efflux system